MTELLNTLYVQTQGASLHLDHDSLKVVVPESPKKTLPLRRLDGIVVYGHVSLSAELLARCAEDGRSVVWMSLAGRFLGRVDGPTRGNVMLRHAQHLAHADPVLRLTLPKTASLASCRTPGNSSFEERATQLAKLREPCGVWRRTSMIS